MYKFFAFIGRMKYINRWSLMRSTQQENIMEHSHMTAVVAHALAVISNTYFDGKLNASDIAVKALFHEISEVVTGDLPTPIKYLNKEINTAYKQIEEGAKEKLITMLPSQLQPTYKDILKEEGIEHKFVKYADKLCAYIKCIEEVKSGNSEFVMAKQAIKKEIDNFASPEVDFFMQNFVSPFEMTLDELG